MGKILIYLSMAFLLLSLVSAVEFTEQTVFTEGNINYIFEPGVDVEITHVGLGGIILNGDNKMSFTPQGGIVNITFLDWDEPRIRVQSDVPQKIDISLNFDGCKQYLFDEKSYYFESISVRYEPLEYTFGTFTSNFEEIDKLQWYEQKFVEFETSTYEDDDGVIHGKTMSITYVYLTLFLLLLILLWVIFK